MLALEEHGCIEKKTQINYSLRISICPSAANSEATIAGLFFQSRSHGSRSNMNIRCTFPKAISVIQPSLHAQHWVHLSSKNGSAQPTARRFCKLPRTLTCNTFWVFQNTRTRLPLTIL